MQEEWVVPPLGEEENESKVAEPSDWANSCMLVVVQSSLVISLCRSFFFFWFFFIRHFFLSRYSWL